MSPPIDRESGVEIHTLQENYTLLYIQPGSICGECAVFRGPMDSLALTRLTDHSGHAQQILLLRPSGKHPVDLLVRPRSWYRYDCDQSAQLLRAAASSYGCPRPGLILVSRHLSAEEQSLKRRDDAGDGQAASCRSRIEGGSAWD